MVTETGPTKVEEEVKQHLIEAERNKILNA